MKKMVNGNLVSLSEEEMEVYKNRIKTWKQEGYKVSRSVQYPSLKDQLENLWDDIEAGVFGEEAKNGKFFQSIEKIKKENPKDMFYDISKHCSSLDDLDSVIKEVFNVSV